MAKSNGARKTKPIDAEVLPPEVALVEREHALMQPWYGNLATWWQGNKGMAEAAQRILAKARLLTAPTTEAEDLQLQHTLLEDKASLNMAEDHAEPFASALFKMHRMVTAARAEVVKPLQQSIDIKQALHNAYTTEQRRIARELEEKLRRQAEDEARERQRQELAELERQAIAREEASADLSDRERKFVDQMVRVNNATQAATIAGYKDPLKNAARLMSLGKITSAINGLKDAEAIRKQALAVSQEPVIPFVSTPAVRPNVSRASGARERTTWSAEVFDLDALHQACLRGECPPDLLMIDMSRLQRYAGELHELIDSWPGVRSKKSVTTF